MGNHRRRDAHAAPTWRPLPLAPGRPQTAATRSERGIRWRLTMPRVTSGEPCEPVRILQSVVSYGEPRRCWRGGSAAVVVIVVPSLLLVLGRGQLSGRYRG